MQTSANTACEGSVASPAFILARADASSPPECWIATGFMAVDIADAFHSEAIGPESFDHQTVRADIVFC